MHTIRLGAKRSSLGRKSYDEQFRLRHVSYLSSSCAVIDAELWLLYIHSEGVMSQGQIAVSKINKCYAINYNGHCQKSVCHYSHTCWRCCGSHSVKFCNLRSSTLGSQGFEQRRFLRPAVNSRSLENGNVPRFSPRASTINNQVRLGPRFY